MTNEDWKKVDNALKSVFSPGAKLLIDGYEVRLYYAKNRNFKTLSQSISTEVLKANGSLKTARNAGVSSAVKNELLLKKKTLRLAEYAARKAKKNLLTDTLTTSIFRIGQTLVK